jgi:hypothetical protein
LIYLSQYSVEGRKMRLASKTLSMVQELKSEMNSRYTEGESKLIAGFFNVLLDDFGTIVSGGSIVEKIRSSKAPNVESRDDAAGSRVLRYTLLKAKIVGGGYYHRVKKVDLDARPGRPLGPGGSIEGWLMGRNGLNVVGRAFEDADDDEFGIATGIDSSGIAESQVAQRGVTDVLFQGNRLSQRSRY